jgi:hypothetical protein
MIPRFLFAPSAARATLPATTLGEVKMLPGREGIMAKNAPLMALALAMITSAAYADSLPKREAGLWEVSVISSHSPTPNMMKECVDGSTDAKLMEMGADMSKSMGGACSKNEFKKTASGFESTSECSIMGSKMTSKGSFTGDFVKTYSGEITTSFSPPMFGQKQSTTKISAKHIGPCSSDMKPGDVIMANGMKMNMNEAAENVKGSAQRLKNANFGNVADQSEINPQAAVAEAMKDMDPEALEMMNQAMQQMGKR